MYGDDFMVLVLSLPESNIVKTRKTRSLLATDEVSPPIKILTCFFLHYVMNICLSIRFLTQISHEQNIVQIEPITHTYLMK